MPRVHNDKAIAAAFGFALRTKRLALGLSQEALAARCQLHRTYLADIERGQRNPSLVSICRVASGLGVPVSELFATMEAHLEQGTRRSRSSGSPS